MAVTIKIGGVDYSIDDPCSIADALRGVRAQRAAGEQVAQRPSAVRPSARSACSFSDILGRYQHRDRHWDNLCKIKTTGKAFQLRRRLPLWTGMT